MGKLKKVAAMPALGPKQIKVIKAILSGKDHLPDKKAPPKENEAYIKALMKLLKLPENTTCADCEARGPRWASVNLGVFLCLQCSGIHRNLGVHVSKVRSISLDSWNKDQTQRMTDIGNKHGNKFWAAKAPPRPKTDSVREMERYIRSKYQDRMWINKKLLDGDDEDDEEEDEEESSEEEPAPPPRRKKAPVRKPAQQPKAQPKPVKQAQPKPVAAPKPTPAPVDNLFDFSGVDPFADDANQAANQSLANDLGFGDMQQSTSSAGAWDAGFDQQDQGFGNFESNDTSQGVDGFGQAMQSQPAAPTQAQKANNIMNAFSGQSQGGMMGMQQQNMMGMQGMPQQQQNMMGVQGMPQQQQNMMGMQGMQGMPQQQQNMMGMPQQQQNMMGQQGGMMGMQGMQQQSTMGMPQQGGMMGINNQMSGMNMGQPQQQQQPQQSAFQGLF